MERKWDGKLPYISDIWKQLASMFIHIKGIEELMLKELKFKKWSASMMADLGGVVTPLLATSGNTKGWMQCY